jgi:glycosyltransferase involved in cell wall biosynthesis
MWDLLRMYFFGFRIAFDKKPDVVHARGHASAQVGLFLKRWLGLKLIFDFRGLWVDERVDKGGWDLSKPFDRWQYRYYKRVERSLLRHADQVVVLTEAVIDEVARLGAQSVSKITFIPCCADFDHFVLADEAACEVARTKFAIAKDAFVLGYLGSVGGMYMSDRFFRLAELAAATNPNVHLVALTPDVARFNAEMHKYLPPALHRIAHVQSASRDEVARLLPAMDVLVSFIRTSYARIASSPTKLAEAFAAGIPAICNYGVGDVANLVQELDAGLMVDADSDHALGEVVKSLPLLAIKGGPRLRDAARQRLGLEVAAKRYRSVYRKLDSTCLM